MPNQPTTAATSEGDFKTFLETASPGTKRKITDLTANVSGGTLNTPELLLHCDSPECSGVRTFRLLQKDIGLSTEEWRYGYLFYLCGNCRKTAKRFALAIHWGEDIVIKIGELPAFGPPTPARLISMIGPHRDFFLKGRRAENQGLGVAAFAYYRRVVEGEKGRIIKEISKVSKVLGADEETLKAFDRAARETQFTAAIEEIKQAIPASILIDGHNPLTLLHSALSEGLHSETDEECLEFAQHIRIIMIELADRLAVALKEDQELKTAVTKLLAKRSQKAAPSKEESDLN
jgi:hypothetical protein